MLVIADKICWSSSLSDGHCLGSLDDGHCFRLDGHGYGSFGIYEIESEKILSLFYIGNDLLVLHQGHCSRVIIVNDPSFFELTE